MTSKINPYLSFKDNARQAMEFYKSVFGGKLDLNTFKEFHMDQDPSEGEKIMHSQLDTDNGMTLMASDTPSSMQYQSGANISISLSGEDEPELREYWNKLIEGGQIIMPLEKAPWDDIFGMVVDQFGTKWMVNVASKKE